MVKETENKTEDIKKENDIEDDISFTFIGMIVILIGAIFLGGGILFHNIKKGLNPTIPETKIEKKIKSETKVDEKSEKVKEEVKEEETNLEELKNKEDKKENENIELENEDTNINNSEDIKETNSDTKEEIIKVEKETKEIVEDNFPEDLANMDLEKILEEDPELKDLLKNLE